MKRDCDLEAPYIGFPDFTWYSDEEDFGIDEDFAYESRRDMELEDELY